MTKPTYSELEASLARVRGLLQRQDDLWMGALCAECENGDRPCLLSGEWIHALTNGDVPCPAMPVFKTVANFRESSSLVSPGAESADIGKLDTADKKCAYCKHTHTFQFDDIVDDDCPVVGCPCMHFLGSAETGGEKADHD